MSKSQFKTGGRQQEEEKGRMEGIGIGGREGGRGGRGGKAGKTMRRKGVKEEGWTRKDE